ncbi:protein jag [Chloroflexota bacterium]
MMELSEERSKVEDAAREVLVKLLEMMELPSSVVASSGYFLQEEDTEDTIALNIEGEDLGILIGRRGQTLASLQYLVRVIVGEKTGFQHPIIVDVEGYRQRRCDNLRNLAWQLAEQVMTRKTSFALEPMSPFDRRVVHLALINNREVTTRSTGVAGQRKVVVVPRG